MENTIIFETSAPCIIGKKSRKHFTKNQITLISNAIQEANKAFIHLCINNKHITHNMPVIIFNAKVITDKQNIKPKPIKKK